jgi:hypothetical protein
VSCLLTLGPAARARELDDAVAVLLDEIETLGGLGPPDRHAQLRAELARIARVLATCWAARPELAATDFYARTLDIPELAEVRLRWMAELDAHGPWARPLRPSATDPALVAVLRDEQDWLHAEGPMVRFVSDHQLELELPRPESEPRRLSWMWTTAELEAQPDRAPMVAPARDPQLEDGDPAPVFRRGRFRRAIALDWPEHGHAQAKLSRDGRSIFAYGWFDESKGLLRVFDVASLKIREAHEFDSGVFDVIEGPESGELLVQTSAYAKIFGRAAPWVLEGFAWRMAWSPSGRYLCTLASGVVEVWDTRERPTRKQPDHGLPLRFADDGARLLDDRELVDGRTGAHVATLEPCFSHYLIGKPRERWLHVGSELIALTHSRKLQLWDACTGTVVESGLANQNLELLCKAYSRSGRVLAFVDFLRTTVALVELPSFRSLAKIDVGLTVYQIATSPDAHFIAVASPTEIEVWGRDGTLRHRAANTCPPAGVFATMDAELTFSSDARELEYYRADFGALVWVLDDEQLGPPRHVHRHPIPGWTAELGPVTVLVDDRGRRLALPHNGPWQVNPRDERILACARGLFELRGV